MIRRTRSEIVKYYGEDLRLQGLRFPDVADPQPVFYKLNKNENAVFLETIQLLTQDFTYARYKPLTYYEGQVEEQQKQSGRNLAKFMKILLVKRLESSFFAFRLTLERFIRTYDKVIAEYRKGRVYISKKHINKIFDLLESDDQEAIERLLDAEKAQALKASDFSEAFIRDLVSDRKVLQRVSDLWRTVKRDPKWEALRELLRNRPELREKLILFTESRETAEYLARCIHDDVDPAVLLFTGDSEEAVRRDVIQNFDARAFHPDDRYRILVATEVLSEGVNLHRSNIVVNYDIPWNPTRLIQRVGRVNRVDTRFETIFSFNFFPTEESNDVIKLQEAAEAKIHAFIEMLGSDARLLTEGEEIKSHDLFAKLNSKQSITGEDEGEESELEYLGEIRAVRDEDPVLFSRIKHLPRKARSTRRFDPLTMPTAAATGALLSYFRQGRLDKFFLAPVDDVSALELDFLSAAKVFRLSDPGEKRGTIPPEFYALLERSKAAFVSATTLDDDNVTSYRGGANDSYILKRLKAREIRNYHGFTEDDEAYLERVVQLLSDGALPRPTTKKLAQSLKKEIDPLRVLAVLRRDIPISFMQDTAARQNRHLFSPREVILSSFIVGEK